MPNALVENKVVCAWPFSPCVQPGTITVKVGSVNLLGELEGCAELEFCERHYDRAASLWGAASIQEPGGPK